MAKPTITDKRWSIDLEKRIQEAHYAILRCTISDMDSTRKVGEKFSLLTRHHPTRAELGTSVRSPNTV